MLNIIINMLNAIWKQDDRHIIFIRCLSEYIVRYSVNKLPIDGTKEASESKGLKRVSDNGQKKRVREKRSEEERDDLRLIDFGRVLIPVSHLLFTSRSLKKNEIHQLATHG